jgi:hypothetical protein
MKYAIALLAVLSLADHAFADKGCPLSRSLTIRFAELFGDLAVAASPELYEARKRERDQRATYDALLTVGVPDQLACATASNPQVLPAILPTYLGIRADAAHRVEPRSRKCFKFASLACRPIYPLEQAKDQN